MGALLNNSNGCPRMPIRNTTAIKAVSILCVEWRPLQQMKALFLLSSRVWSHASISSFSACRSIYFFIYSPGATRERCLGFEAGHICGGKQLSAYFIPIWIVPLCSLQGETRSVRNWVKEKLPRQTCYNIGSKSMTSFFPNLYPPSLTVVSYLVLLKDALLIIALARAFNTHWF